MRCERKQGILYPGRVLTGAGRTNGGGEASGSGRFRVGGWVWRGRYKRRVSSCSQVIVYSMFVHIQYTIHIQYSNHGESLKSRFNLTD